MFDPVKQVLASFPKAICAERQTEDREYYYVILASEESSLVLGSGSTPEEVWADASDCVSPSTPESARA